MRIFLLGPGYYEGDESRNALYERLRLAEMLEPHEVIILELSDLEEPNLTSKFKAAMEGSDAVVVWLPRAGRLTTVFGELLLLRYEERWHGRHVTVLSEEGVLDIGGDQFRVLHRDGQVAFLLDLPEVYNLQVFEYSTVMELDVLVGMYADGNLEA